jgi:hypothetical protein
VVGHSLGGAMAQLMASEVSICRPDLKVGLVTFGMPRCLSKNTATKTKWSYPHWRVVNDGDPVPTVPPAEFGFSHNSSEIFHYNTNQVREHSSNLHVFLLKCYFCRDSLASGIKLPNTLILTVWTAFSRCLGTILQATSYPTPCPTVTCRI